VRDRQRKKSRQGPRKEQVKEGSEGRKVWQSEERYEKKEKKKEKKRKVCVPQPCLSLSLPN
jgi:hypothetical protein